MGQAPSMQQFGAIQGAGPPRGPGHGASYGSGSISASGPPQLSTLPFQNTQTPPSQQAFQQPAQAPLAQNSYSQPPQTLSVVNLPPLKPVFGMSLEQLFERDGSAVPMVVYQCIQAVDLFGLEVEGIYRLSGTYPMSTKLKLCSTMMLQKWISVIQQIFSTMLTVLLVFSSNFSVISQILC